MIIFCNTELAFAHPRFLLRRLICFHRGHKRIRVSEVGLLWLLVGIVLVVVVVIRIEQLLVVLPTLNLASIAFGAEWKVKVVAFEADPVLRSLVVCGRDTFSLVGRNLFTNLTHMFYFIIQIIEVENYILLEELLGYAFIIFHSPNLTNNSRKE